MKYSKRQFHLICKTCNKTFIANSSNQKYCSEECKPKVKCNYCGEEFVLIRSRNEKYFCSRSCSVKYQMSHLTNEQKEKLSEIGKNNIKKANEYWKTEEGKSRKSKICARTNATPERAALVSKQWKNEEFKAKMSNGVKERWKTGIYGNLAKENLEKINFRCDKYCDVCNQITKHNGFGTCLSCNPNAGGFNREDFYKSYINLIKLNDLDNFNIVDIKSLIKIPGIWSIWDKQNNICFQVGQNKDIGCELFRQIRLFNKYGSDEWPNDHKNAEYFHLIGSIMLNNNLQFKIVKENVCDCNKRLLIEAQYAWENKAKYWSPEPGQRLYKEEILI